VFFHAQQHGRSEVVDADLADYFHEIPHGDLLRSVARRVSDGHVLRQIRSWIRSAVVERKGRRERRTRESARRSRGVAQGGPLTPPTQKVTWRSARAGGWYRVANHNRF
jgi:retron-type reverse transcriptase